MSRYLLDHIGRIGLMNVRHGGIILLRRVNSSKALAEDRTLIEFKYRSFEQ